MAGGARERAAWDRASDPTRMDAGLDGKWLRSGRIVSRDSSRARSQSAAIWCCTCRAGRPTVSSGLIRRSLSSSRRLCCGKSSAAPCGSSRSTRPQAARACSSARPSRMPAPSSPTRGPRDRPGYHRARLRRFRRLAFQCHARSSRCSPIMLAYGDLVLDITGVSHLFGGERRCWHAHRPALAALGFHRRRRRSPRPSARPGRWRISPPGRDRRDRRSRSRWLVAAGRGAAARGEQIDSLKQLGLKPIGQLYDRDRQALQARFGASLHPSARPGAGLTRGTAQPAPAARRAFRRTSLRRADRADRRRADDRARPRHPADIAARSRRARRPGLPSVPLSRRPQGDDAFGQCRPRDARCPTYRPAVPPSRRAARGRI